MTQHKHTPGPWEVTPDTAGESRVVVPGYIPRGGLFVPFLARTFWTREVGGIPLEQAEANARLIAAAPDLLAACKAAARFISNGVELGYIRLPDFKDDPALKTLPEIRAAIAKAEAGVVSQPPKEQLGKAIAYCKRVKEIMDRAEVDCRHLTTAEFYEIQGLVSDIAKAEGRDA